MLREIWEDRDDRVCANCARFPEAKPKSASRYLCTFAEFYGEDGADENGWIGAESTCIHAGTCAFIPARHYLYRIEAEAADFDADFGVTPGIDCPGTLVPSMPCAV